MSLQVPLLFLTTLAFGMLSPDPSFLSQQTDSEAGTANKRVTEESFGTIPVRELGRQDWAEDD